MQKATIQQKLRPNRCIRSAGNLFTDRQQDRQQDRQTDRQTDRPTDRETDRHYKPSLISWRCDNGAEKKSIIHLKNAELIIIHMSSF